jgi:hypothetical protein
MKPPEYKWIPDPPTGRPPDDRLVMTKSGVLTERVHFFFKRAIFAVMLLETNRTPMPQIIDASEGIITELPRVPIKEVVQKQGKGFEHLYRDNATQRHVIEKWLASQRMYVVNFGEVGSKLGLRYVESEDWRQFIPRYIDGMKKNDLPVEDYGVVWNRITELESELAKDAGMDLRDYYIENAPAIPQGWFAPEFTEEEPNGRKAPELWVAWKERRKKVTDDHMAEWPAAFADYVIAEIKERKQA